MWTDSACEKDLGVYMDNFMNFDKQRNEKVKVATNVMGAIWRSFMYLNCETFKLL